MSERIEYLQRVLTLLKEKSIIYAISKVKGSKYRVSFMIGKGKNEILVNTRTLLLAWVCTHQISNNRADAPRLSEHIGHVSYEDNDKGRCLCFKVAQFMPALEGTFVEEWLEIVLSQINNIIQIIVLS